MKEEQVGLITACLQGDETAIAQLIQKYQLGIFRLCLSVLNDPNEANEATQDTFIAALQALNGYRDKSSFKAWLYTIALNTSRSRLRKHKAIERLQNMLTNIFTLQSQHSPNVEDMVVNNEEDTALWNTLEQLGEKHRVPIVLRYYHNFSAQEIADILKIKIGTVYSRLSIGRDRLRKTLENRKLERNNG